MKKDVAQILEKALQMSPEDRATVAERLLASLDSAPDLEVEKAWQQEIQKRLKELDSGEFTCVPWEQVRSRLRGYSSVTN